MKRLIAFLCLLALTSLLSAQGEPVPTLVPPTLVPQPETGAEDILPSRSTAARIAEDGVVRVGILYNAPPFGELNIRGDLSGFDADLARAMAQAWGVEVEFVQVTRQVETMLQMLRNGEVDMLAATLVRRRELDSVFEFSETYYMSQQAVMVLADDPATTPAELNGRNGNVGVVIATPSQRAVDQWAARTNTSVNVSTYLTLDRAYAALAAGEVTGIIDSRYRLQQLAVERPDLTRILETPVQRDPFAIATLRQDVAMRNLVNRTLQHLTVTGQLDEIHQRYFPGAAYDPILIWDNLDEDAPNPSQYPADLVFPAERVFTRLRDGGTLRVAGLYGITADSDAPESERRLDIFHREMLQAMADRWNVAVEFIPATPEEALQLVASGGADVAVGVEADWEWTNRVDFTGFYLLHGERLMVREDDEINNFIDLRGGTTVITPANEATAATRAVEIAELPNVNARIDILQEPEGSLAFAMLADEEIEAEAAFGDSLKLIPHVQAEPERLRLTDQEDGSPRWYSPSNRTDEDFAPRRMVMAVPYNDIDFRLLVEYTLQEIARDGTLANLLQPVMLADEIPEFEIWPGSSMYLGIELAGN